MCMCSQNSLWPYLPLYCSLPKVPGRSLTRSPLELCRQQITTELPTATPPLPNSSAWNGDSGAQQMAHCVGTRPALLWPLDEIIKSPSPKNDIVSRVMSGYKDRTRMCLDSKHRGTVAADNCF